MALTTVPAQQNLQGNLTMAQLATQLRQSPVHAARYDLEQAKWGRLGARDSADFVLPVPQTGIQPVDMLVDKANNVVSTTVKSPVRIAQAALKGAVYGGIGGVLGGLLPTVYAIGGSVIEKLTGSATGATPMSLAWKVLFPVGLGLAGALLGGLYKGVTEIYRSVRDIQRSLTFQ